MYNNEHSKHESLTKKEFIAMELTRAWVRQSHEGHDRYTRSDVVNTYNYILKNID